MLLPPSMQDKAPLLPVSHSTEKVSHSTEKEKENARIYVWIAVLIFFILFIVGILLIAFSKMNEKNENDTAGIALAVVGGLSLFFLILYACKHSDDL